VTLGARGDESGFGVFGAVAKHHCEAFEIATAYFIGLAMT